MTKDQMIFNHRLSLLSRAKSINNISRACREAGVSRTYYYKWADRFVIYGAQGLYGKPKPKPVMPNRARSEVVDKILDFIKTYPTYGPARIANQLGGIVCSATIYNILRRRGLNRRLDRLLALEEYTIIPEFRDWALEALREEHKKEVTDREKIQKTRQRTYKDIQDNINKLIDMKLYDQITDKEYQIKRNSLIEDKARIKQELNQIDSRADSWLELTEKAFNFITNLREAFKDSDIRLKKDILMALGKKITVKDGNLSIEPNEWLIPIKEKYPVLEEQFLGLEPAESLLNTRENEGLVSVCSQWKTIGDSNSDSKFIHNGQPFQNILIKAKGNSVFQGLL